MKAAARDAKRFTPPPEFGGAMIRARRIDCREEIATLRKLIEQLFQTRSNAQKAMG